MLYLELSEEKNGRERTRYYLLDFQKALLGENPYCLTVRWGSGDRKAGEEEHGYAAEESARAAAGEILSRCLGQGYRLVSAVDPWFDEVLAAAGMATGPTNADVFGPSVGAERDAFVGDMPAFEHWSRSPSGDGPVIYSSNHLPVLLDQLAEEMRRRPLPVLETETIVVPSYGMGRWLTLRLAEKLGIAASLELPFPTAFFTELADRVLGSATEHNPFADPDCLTWWLFGMLPTHAGQPEFASIEGYLRDDPLGRKRYQLASRIAACFDEYQVYRPELLAGWSAGQTGDARHESWQAELWRRLVRECGAEDRASRLLRLRNRLARGSAPPNLPRRVCFFAPAALPPLYLDLIAALARHVPVAIHYLNPTFHYWGDLPAQRRRKPDAAAANATGEVGEAANALLASMGTSGRHFFQQLQQLDPSGNAWVPLEFTERRPDTLLARLQTDVLELVDRRPGGTEAPLPLQPGDRSLRVHRCHSPLREMEVMRDQLLDTFDADPDLQPHEVLVLVPDIGTYAPFVQAVFGLDHPLAPRLPYTIADRSLREQWPLVDTAVRLFRIATGRLGVAEIMDLLEEPALRRRFNITPDDLPALRNWADRTRIRWGMDGRQRRRDFDLPALEANTWRRGLERLLLGYATGRLDQLVNGTLPVGEATTSRAALLGAFAHFAETLFRYQPRLSRPKTLAQWTAVIKALLSDFFLAQDEQEEETLQLVRDVLDAWALAGAGPYRDEPIAPVVFREHLANRFADPGSGGGFISGAITFCALKPMRTIPYKVICIAGLNEADFPRRRPRPGFSLLNGAPRRGDRVPRDDDRYLFLETLMAAEHRLILSYVGRSAKDNSELAPSVVLSELLDHLDLAFHRPGGGKVRAALVVDHPLQAFSRRCFNGSDAEVFSYSLENFQGLEQRASAGAPDEPGAEPFIAEPFIANPLSFPEEVTAIDLGELIAFWQHPCKFFCREVLQLALYEDATAQNESESFKLSALEGYTLDSLLIERRLRGQADSEREYAEAEGILPLAGLGSVTFDQRRRDLDLFWSTLNKHAFSQTQLLEVARDDWRLSGVVANLGEVGRIQYRPARIKAKDLVSAWICHLVLNAQADPGVRNSLVLGMKKEGKARAVQRIAFPPLAGAHELLADLVAAFREGRRRPPPFFTCASHDYAAALHKGSSDPLKKALDSWTDSKRPNGEARPGDESDPYVRLCFRGRDPFGEEFDQFESWARLFWDPLLEHSHEVGS